MSGENKVAREVAEAELVRFMEAMDLDADKSKMDPDDLKSFEEVKAKFVAAIERGQLVVDEKGRPVFTTSTGEALTFNEPTGASFMAMDAKKKDHNVGKMLMVLADITGRDAKVFSKLPNRDFKVCQAIVSLFLA